MDTQTTGPGGNQGTNSSDDLLGDELKPTPSKSPSMKMPSLPKKSGVEPPADLPFVDDAGEEEKPAQVVLAKEVPVVIKPTPKIVPGVRGPLPSAPTSPMKSSSAKFGIGTAIKGSAVKDEIKKTGDPTSVPHAKEVVELDDDVTGGALEDELNLKSDGEMSEPDVHSTLPVMRPKIGVPRPPVAPASVAEKDIEELLNKTTKNDGVKMDGKNIPPPTVPPSSNVDRNIRPRRLALVVIVLLLFVAVIFMALWYFLTRGNSVTTTTSPTDASLFSPEPTTDVSTSTPSVNTLSQTDSDGDGLTDEQEIKLGTDSFKVDTDGDGYEDKQEIDAGYDPLVNGGKLDTDRDGLADPDEKCWGTDLRNPDTDGDGYLDGQEVVNGYDPLTASPNDKLTGAARCNI